MEKQGLLRLAKPRPSVSPTTSVMDAVRIMTEHHVGAVGVTEGPRIVGVFTERDLMKRVVFPGKDPAATPVAAVMSSPVKTVQAYKSVEEATALMRMHHIRHLAVVDEHGQFRGIIALRYLLYDLTARLQRRVGDLQGVLMADGPGG